MSITEIMQEELFKDKNLFSVYKNSVFYSETNLDRLIKYSFLFFLSAMSLYVLIFDRFLFSIEIKSISNWLSLGFSYSTTILGFLVAGFTIFATMTKVEIFIALSVARHTEKKVSQIKFIFYSFLRVFINHIVLLFFCVSIIMLKDSANIYLAAFGFNINNTITIKQYAVSMIFPLLGYLLIGSVLQLKSFVWNLYQSVIIAVAGAVRLYEVSQRTQ